MQIYWTARSVPELAPLPLLERWAVMREAAREYSGVRWRLAYGLPGVVATLLGLWLGATLTDRSPMGVLVALPLIFVGSAIGNTLLIKHVRPYLPTVIASRKH